MCYGRWFFNYSVLLVVLPLSSKELFILEARVHGFPPAKRSSCLDKSKKFKVKLDVAYICFFVAFIKFALSKYVNVLISL